MANTDDNSATKRQIIGCFVVILSLPVLVVVGCGVMGLLADYLDSLPNGYSVVYCSSHDASIWDPNGKRVVFAHVAEWSVHGDIVAGFCSGADAPFRHEDQWFLLDTVNGKVTYFDAKSDMEKTLQRELSK